MLLLLGLISFVLCSISVTNQQRIRMFLLLGLISFVLCSISVTNQQRIRMLLMLGLISLVMPQSYLQKGCLADPSLFQTITPLNIQAYLDAFEEGGCTPLVILPGAFATKLQVQIDCELMQKESHSVFTTCGWNSCNREYNPIQRLLYNINVPETEYSLWIPQINTPMSPLQLTRSESLCFNYLLAMQPNQNITSQYDKYGSKVKGVSFRIYGETPLTKQKDNCGDSAITDLFNYFHQDFFNHLNQDCEHIAYGKLIDDLYQMGYRRGLTYQSLPYDFRIPSKHNPVTLRLLKAVKKLHYLNNNKKVMIMAHSYGNIMTMQSLHSVFSEEEKERMILQYIAIGAPLSGVVKSVRVLLGGYAEMHRYGLGFDYIAQQSMMFSTGTLLETLPFKYLHQSDNQLWMQSLKERVQREQENKPHPKDQKDSWLPGPSESCYKDDNGETGISSCGLHLSEFMSIKDTLIQMTQQSKTHIYGIAQIDSLLSQLKISQDLLDDTREHNEVIQEMQFPNVNMLCIMGRTFKTEQQLTYSDDPVHNSMVDQRMSTPSYTQMGLGDATINHWSILIPIYKWLYQGTNNHTIHLASFCSSYNNQQNQLQINPHNHLLTYDGANHTFMGIDCLCNQHYDHTCSHACQINNPNLLSFIFKTIQIYKQETHQQKHNRQLLLNPYRQIFIENFKSQANYCYDFDVTTLA